MSFETMVFLQNPETELPEIRHEFFIDDDSFEEILTILEITVGFDSSSSLGHAHGEADNIHLSALLGCASQFGSKNSLGIQIFEDSRQLFLDVEVAQSLELVEEVRLGELQAAFVYKSLFSDNDGFYRKLRVEDFENWGLRGWAVEVLGFIEGSIDSIYGKGMPAKRPTLLRREGIVRRNIRSEQLGEAVFGSEIKLLKRISTVSSARKLELCAMNQYLRENAHDRGPYFDYLVGIAAPAMNIQEDEAHLFFFESVGDKPIALGGEWTKTGKWQIATANVAVDFAMLDDIWAFCEACLDTDASQFWPRYANQPETYFYLAALSGNPDPSQIRISKETSIDFWVELTRSAAPGTPLLSVGEPHLPTEYARNSLGEPVAGVASVIENSFDNYERALRRLMAGCFANRMDWVEDKLEKLLGHELIGVFLLLLLDQTDFGSSAEDGHEAARTKLTNAFIAHVKFRSELTANPNGESKGFVDLFETLRTSGLEIPYFPANISASLANLAQWKWGTKPNHNFLDDYLFFEAIERARFAKESNYAFVGHAGHGINSYALTLNMKVSSVAIVCQAAWGGALMEGPQYGQRWNQMMDDLGRVFGALCNLEQHGPEDTHVLLYVSNSRCMPTLEISNDDGSFEKLEFETLHQAARKLLSIVDSQIATSQDTSPLE